MSTVAVVTIAHGRGEHLAAQHRSLARGTRLPEVYLVVAMDDPDLAPATLGGLRREVLRQPTSPLGLPLAAARNRGVTEALARGADVVVLLDVDCLAGADLVAAYERTVTEHPGTVWAGPVTYLDPPPGAGYDLDDLAALDSPHPARPAPKPGELLVNDRPELLWSLSLACGPDAWRAGGGFCEEYVGYGGEDTDLGFALRAAGVGLGWIGGARAFHQHHDVESPPVRHLDDILRNGRLFHARWGEWPMLGWLERFEELGLVRRAGDGWERAQDPGYTLP